MKNLTNFLSTNAKIVLAAYLFAFLVLPIKLVVLLTFVYLVIHSTGAFKLRFPDVWKLEENEDDFEKVHKTFLFFPACVDGTWYVFQYVNRVIIDGKTTLSIRTAGDDSEEETHS